MTPSPTNKQINKKKKKDKRGTGRERQRQKKGKKKGQEHKLINNHPNIVYSSIN